MLNELWDSDAKRLKKLRDNLQAMTDQQLLDYGRDCGEMCADKYMRVSYEPDPWLLKLAKLALSGAGDIRSSRLAA
jgi:hypothetical protein